MNSSKKIYMYDAIGRQHNVTQYYDTGLFYIYTDPEDSTSQSFIRKNKLDFMDRETFLRALKDNKIIIKKEYKELLTRIINANPNFIENMDYNRSIISEENTFSDVYQGFYKINNQDYTIVIYLDRYSVDNINHNKIDDIIILINKGNQLPRKSYEEMRQIAARPF